MCKKTEKKDEKEEEKKDEEEKEEEENLMDKAKKLGSKLIKALSYMNHNKFIMRGLYPNNIFLSGENL